MHTNLCDGKNTIKEMIEASIDLGCEEIGFSGHSYLKFDPDWTMSPSSACEYRSTLRTMQKKYGDKISIKIGVEQDFMSATEELPLYDYVIGGVHCLEKNGKYISVDESAKRQLKAIEEVYDGDAMAFAEDYFDTVAKIYDRTRCNIIAHFDLINKFGLIDTDNPRYIAAEKKAFDTLIKTPAIFEINTGAISRGYADEPYPNKRVLGYLSAHNAKVILSSDSHSVDTILFGFDKAEALAESYGLEILRKI